MKKLIILSMFFILSTSCHSQETTFPRESLKKALIKPDNTNTYFAEVLNKHVGKTTVIEVWASWCSDCVKAMPKVKELQAAHPEVDYVFISMDKDYEKWLAGIEKHELQGDHYWATDGMKGQFGKSINLDWIPRYIVIDKTGKIIIYRAIETDFEKIDEALNKLKDEK
jgi:thiol-disulfide isomerase/thioredoxin